MKPLLIFKVGTTFDSLRGSYDDFEDWIIRGLGEYAEPVKVLDPRTDPCFPDPQNIAGAIITGSHSMVSDREPWSEALATWLQTALACELPILGICYGHQLLAHASGGRVDYHPDGLEIGTVDVSLCEAAASDPLFTDLPNAFAAHATHKQSVLTLPEAAVLLGFNAFEPHHAFRIGGFAWGVQFHPEFSPIAMRHYVEQRCEDPVQRQALLSEIRDTPESADLLKRFGQLVRAKNQP